MSQPCAIGNGPLSQIFKTADAGATCTLQFKNDDASAFYDALAFSDAAPALISPSGRTRAASTPKWW